MLRLLDSPNMHLGYEAMRNYEYPSCQSPILHACRMPAPPCDLVANEVGLV